MALKLFLILFVGALFHCHANPVENYDEEAGKKYLDDLNEQNGKWLTKISLASWDYESNITDHNLKKQLEANAAYAKFEKERWQETIKFPWKTFEDYDTKRQFKKYAVLGTAALPEEKVNRLNEIVAQMSETYAKAKICDFKDKKKCDLSLEPELTKIMKTSTDPEELKYVWKEWRRVSGAKVRDLYTQYVDLSNEAAVINNFTDNSEYWLKDYEAKDFREQVQALWEQIRPLYLQIHAYVRQQLRKKYGDEVVSKTGPIPAHLLGNMWAQNWDNISPFTLPFPDHKAEDITSEMVKQGYTAEKMFKLSEDFFVSLNLSAMPELFWKNSLIEKPKDRDLVCHASAWDFYDSKDFRIKQCTTVDIEDLYTVHHEMGHIQYYLQYKDRPVIYREGANPGFHEAVGDVMSLSVSTPKHLRKIGLLKSEEENYETDLNHLYTIGLEKIAFMPFSYLLDLWRWDVFGSNIKPENYNCEWWKLRNEYQGIDAPVERSENDFDPGSKYHVIASVPYIRYFVSYVVQFQFHRALCEKAGQYVPNDPTKPLHRCDIYQSKEAGNALKAMLQMGSSRPWPDAMEAITGQRTMDASGLLEYFKPLQDWLEKQNKDVHIGWDTKETNCAAQKN